MSRYKTRLRKISIIFQKVKDLAFVFLQETHFKNDYDAETFDRIFEAEFHIYHTYTVDDNSKTGVSILVNRKSPVTNMEQVFVHQGRSLGVTFAIGSLSLFLVGVYICPI